MSDPPAIMIPMMLDERSRRLLAIVADHFGHHSLWPEATELQRSLILENDNEDLVVWDEVARLPSGLLRREPNRDGRELIVATVRGLAHSGGVKAELDSFLKLVHHFVDAWKEGVEEVPQSEFSVVLGVPEDVTQRVVTILKTEGLVAYARHTNEGQTTWCPAKNSVFQFRTVNTVEDYIATVERLLGEPTPLTSNEPVAQEVIEEDIWEVEKSLGTEAKNGFLLMPFANDLDWLHGAIRRAGALEGALMKRADDISSPGVVLEQVFSAIDEADLVVSVCTDRNPNVFFEMGYAWREHKVILVAEGSDDLPFDVQHFRTVLYGEFDPATIVERLRSAMKSVLAEEGLPVGRRLTSPPAIRTVARLACRLETHGKSRRLVITNSGTVPVNDIDIEVPPEATSFHVITHDLPLKILRPGQSVALPATAVMGGGPGIFDITLKGTTENGELVEEFVTLSLYG